MKIWLTMKNLLFIPLALLFCACAVHYGNTSSNAALTDGDFRIMNLASGQAMTRHVLGIGGLNKDALVLEAKRNMYRSHPLDDGQIYANMAVDYKRTFYLIVVETKVTVSADVVQFSPTTEQKETDIFSGLKIISNRDDAVDPTASRKENLNERVGVLVGDELKTMTLKKVISKKRYELETADSVRFIYRREMIYFFRNEGRFDHGFEPGEEITLMHEGEEKTGKILGVNEESMVIESDSKIFEIPPAEIETDK